jgi:Na+-driven multidrug efflux pump
MIPLAFGFGTALVAMVGTNWGARQHRRARTIAWIGAGTVAAVCGIVGLFFTFFPTAWMGLFTNEAKVIQVGTLYLRTVGPMYAAYGLGMAIYFAMQGTGNVIPAVLANALRLLTCAGGAAATMLWLDANPLGVFMAIACGFVLYGSVSCYLLMRR